MAFRSLTAPNSPDATQRVQLDGREYVLRWRWLERLQRWALDISSATGTLLAGGLAVVPMFPLLADVRGARDEMPPGELFIFDPRPFPRVPTLEGIGGATSLIVYVEAADLAEAA